MSIWTRIADALSALAQGEPLSAVFDRLRGQVESPPERSVGFTIAIIALSAKIAKADGQVTKDEVTAFRRIFTIDESELGNAARVYNLARQDVAGFDAYARKVAAMFGADDRQTLEDVLEGLFAIALADGAWHPAEEEMLAQITTIFALPESAFRALRARFVDGAPRDPHEVLGVPTDAPLDTIKSAWKTAVRENHPDRMVARGVPPEAVKLAERRLIAINAAWEEISRRRAA
jgi:DnaJ like chaperone protein